MSLKPERAVRVGKTKRYGTENWRFIPNRIKAVHASGRTSPDIGGMWDQGDVDELVDEYGTFYPYMSRLSITQQLDLIATEILRCDRLENVDHKFASRRDYLSPGQWHVRAMHEIPFPDLDAVVQARESDRSKRYAERMVNVPWDKTGDHYFVWTLP